ncbi:UNVERIFIED_CONTAM: hypothetical protein FKN15_011029 [Acipenser sinensis]
MGASEKNQLSKKEKIKQRREKWLNKIDTIKLDREKQKALAKRKATPVVGDMQALADALPDLSELLTASRIQIDTIKLDREKQKALAKRKATPVVGDMQALADALPDLSELLTASRIRSIKKLKTIVKKPEPKEFSKMKHAQKRKFFIVKKPEPKEFSKMKHAQKRKFLVVDMLANTTSRIINMITVTYKLSQFDFLGIDSMKHDQK